MSVDTSWDIESYRAAYESDEHWALKREFLEAHKERIPEARLICLAQTFVNIELLGCKYPDALMRQVEVLARDVACDFKENKKNMLQRTFVKASDAAGAKVKGTSTSALLDDCASFKPSIATEDDEGGEAAHQGPMSSLLGTPPTPLSSRLPMTSFTKGSNSSQVGSSVSDGASTSNPSFGGSLGAPKAAGSTMGFVSGGTLMPSGFVSGGTTSSNKPGLSGSGSTMGFVSGGTMASNKPGLSGAGRGLGFVSGGTMASNKPGLSGAGRGLGFVSGGTMAANKPGLSGSGSGLGFVSGGTMAANKPGLGGSGSGLGFVSGGTMATNKPGLGGSGRGLGFVSGGTMTAKKPGLSGAGRGLGFVPGGTTAANKPGSSGAGSGMGFVSGGTLTSNKPAFSGSANSMGFVPGGTITPNKRTFGGSATGLSSTGFVSSGTLTPGTKTAFSAGTTGFAGSQSMASKCGGGGQSLLGTPNTSMYGSAKTNSLLPLPTDTTTTTTTTLITAPPAPKKKKSKDKDKNKPITEKFVKFIGGMSEDATTPESMDKMANTVPLQSYGARAAEKGQGFVQPGQSQQQQQHQQQQQQQQPSTAAAATATPQHNHLANWCKVVGRDNPLAGFVVVRHENHENGGAAAAILNTSSCFSRMPVNYHYQKKDHFHECTVNINGVDVVTSRASGRKKAREQAVVDAVAELPKLCFTLKIKKNIRAESVTLEQLGEDLANRNPVMDNTNSVASKMMKQMGWTGGGLGKKGEGITEPIRPSEVFGRQGLGHTGNKGAVTPAFRKRVREIVSDYASTSKKMALAFSNDFSKEQRAEIHKIARLCHLKSATRGRDTSNRCLVITRKMPAQDLLLRLLQEGSNDQYELLPPSSSSSFGSTYGSAYSSSYGSSSTSTC